MNQIVNKTFKANTKDVLYLNRDFSSLKQQLIDFTKQYFPQSYRDFSESSQDKYLLNKQLLLVTFYHTIPIINLKKVLSNLQMNGKI